MTEGHLENNRLPQYHTLWLKYLSYRVGQKSKPAYCYNNFVYCQPIFRIFGTYTVHYTKFATGRYKVSPPNTVYVSALPCKILIKTLPICLYMFTTINNN